MFVTFLKFLFLVWQKWQNIQDYNKNVNLVVKTVHNYTVYNIININRYILKFNLVLKIVVCMHFKSLVNEGSLMNYLSWHNWYATFHSACRLFYVLLFLKKKMYFVHCLNVNVPIIYDTGFVGADCSVSNTHPPRITSVDQNGWCSLTQRICGTVQVFATNIYNSGRLTCRYLDFRYNF